MTDNRICAVCGFTIATIDHQIFGGSPTFHGFIDSGRRDATLPGLDPPGSIVPPAVRDYRASQPAEPGTAEWDRRAREFDMLINGHE